MKMDVSKFKKISSDKKKTVLQHPSGHRLVIAHDALNKENLASLGKIPAMYQQAKQTTDDSGVLKMAKGGEAKHSPIPVTDYSDVPMKENKMGGKPMEVEYGQSPEDYNPTQMEHEPHRPMMMANGGEAAKNYADFIESHPQYHKANMPPDVEEWRKQKHEEQQPGIVVPPPSPYSGPVAQNFAVGGEALPEAAPAMDRPLLPGVQEDIPPAPMPAVPHYKMPSPNAEDPYAEAAKTSLGGIEKQQAGAQQAASALGEQGKQEADVYGMAANDMNRRQAVFDKHFNDLMAERQKVYADWNGGHIDPQQFVKSMSTGDKIMSGVGLMLSGFGSGLSGQPNLAYDYINKQIDRDIDSQKANIHNKATLMNANLNQTGNLIDAAKVTQMQTMDLTSMHLKQVAASMQDPLKRAELLNTAGQLDQKASEIQTQIATRQALMQTYGGQEANQEPQFQKRMQILKVMGQKDMAEGMEKRHVPGVGTASRDVPEDALKSITARNALNDAILDLQNFGSQHSGSLNPSMIAQGTAKAALVQDMVRQASNAGVFKESEKEFMNRYVGENPTQLFQKYRSGKGYEEVRRNNQLNLNALKETYGLPVKAEEKGKAAGTPNIQYKGGVPYMKVPGGWKKVK